MWSNQGQNTLVFPPGATTGARLIIGLDPSTGLEGIFAYSSTNVLIFSLTGNSDTAIGFLPIAQGDQGNIYWIDGYANHAALYVDNGLLATILRGPFLAGSQNVQVTVNPNNNLGAVGGSLWITAWNPSHANTEIASQGIAVNGAASDVIHIGGTVPVIIGKTFTTLAGAGSNTATIQFGDNAIAGNYYYEEFAIAAGASFPNGASAKAIGTVAGSPLSAIVQHTDYASAFNVNTGDWTCPADGIYTMTGVCFFNLNVAAARLITFFTDGLGNRLAFNDKQTVGFNDTLSATKFIAAGTVVSYEINQTSGAVRTISAAAGLNSYISFKRHL
jgi:hypothetical protein